MGGVRGLVLLPSRLATIAIAASNCAFRLRRDAAAYQAAPRRGLPRMRGMARDAVRSLNATGACRIASEEEARVPSAVPVTGRRERGRHSAGLPASRKPPETMRRQNK
jgi:hypothetical protein